MEIAGIAAAGNPEPSKPAAGMGQDMFLTLLVAQLKAQNPLEPLDPEQFVSQLVQFNTLDQIIQIREALETNPNPTNQTGDAAGVDPVISA